MPAAADPEIAAIFHRPFAEQVAFFRGKLGRLVPTAVWRDLLRAEHDRAFMVAGAAKADLLADLAEAVDKAIADDETLDQFRQRFVDIVQKHGWQGWTGSESEAGRAWRTRVIYRPICRPATPRAVWRSCRIFRCGSIATAAAVTRARSIWPGTA